MNQNTVSVTYSKILNSTVKIQAMIAIFFLTFSFWHQAKLAIVIRNLGKLIRQLITMLVIYTVLQKWPYFNSLQQAQEDSSGKVTGENNKLGFSNR